jgi:hypothetical protein
MPIRIVVNHAERNRLLGLCPPLLLSVIQVPLIHQRDDALIRAPRDDQPLWLSIGEREALFYHPCSYLRLRILNTHPLELPNQHDTIVEAFLVCELFRFGKLLRVLLRLDLQELDDSRSGELAVGGCGQDRDRIDGCPGRIDVIECCFFAEVKERLVVVGRVGWNGRYDSCSLEANMTVWRNSSQCWTRTDLGRQDIVHGQDVDFWVERKRRPDLRPDKADALDLEQLVDLASSQHHTLESHVTCSTGGAYICLLVVDGKNAILDRGADEAIRLTIPEQAELGSGNIFPRRISESVHGLRPQGRRHQVCFPPSKLAIDHIPRRATPFLHLELQRSVLLRAHTFSILTIVIHTRLSVFGTIDRVPLAKLDLAQGVQFVRLPAYERVVVGIQRRGDKGATPVDP